MIDFEIGFVVGALSAVFVYCCYRAWELWQCAEGEWVPKTNHDQVLIQAIPGVAKSVNLDGPEIGKGFAVSGKPHRVPWQIRKRELTEAAKKKRRQYESFQEID